MKRIAAMLMILALIATWTAGALAQSDASAPAIAGGSQAALPTLTPEQFIISFWVAPPEEETTPERYKEIAEAGFNLVMPWAGYRSPTNTTSKMVAVNQRVLDLCKSNGMKAIIGDPRIELTQPDDPNFARDLDAVISDYASHPALYGYHLQDEPSSADFPRLAAINRYLRAKDPKHVPYINLLPNVAFGGFNGKDGQMDSSVPYPTIANAYREHVAQFISTVGPALLSYDEYDLFVGGGIRGMYFGNLGIIRQMSLEHALPFNNIVLLTSHHHPHGVYRDPSMGDLRFLVYTTLAYGGRGLTYFTYWTLPALGFSDAIIGAKGSRTEHYGQVSQLNREIRALAPVLSGLKSKAVYHAGNVPLGATALPAGEVLEKVDGGDILAGFFSSADGRQYVMIVNKDLNAGHRITLAFQKPVELVEISHRTGLPTSRGLERRFSFDFDAGGGRLFELRKASDPPVVSKE